MSWRDRPYNQDEPGPRMQFALPPWTPVVKWLVIVNVAVFVVSIALKVAHVRVLGGDLFYVLGNLDWRRTVLGGQVWRLVTYQYLHSGPMHILLNMLMLWFLGPLVATALGPRRFLAFYTFAGVVAGLLFLAMAPLVGQGGNQVLIGASGSILGVVAAAAILHPQQRIYLFFVPMTMRTMALVFVVFYVLTIRDLSQVAHLGGMIGGAGWMLVARRLEGRAGRAAKGRWQRHLAEAERDRQKVDRILAKVHAKGIHSLNWFEKRALRKATEREQTRDRRIDRDLRG